MYSDNSVLSYSAQLYTVERHALNVPGEQAFIKGFEVYSGVRHDSCVEVQIIQSVVSVQINS